MNKQTEAIHKALKVLNCLNNDRVYETAWVKGAINACEEALEQQEIGEAEIRQMLNDIEYYQKRVEALEQPAQEPVAWMYTKKGDYGYTEDSVEATTSENYAINLSITPVIPLYTHPHQWQGLTDDEIQELTHYDIKFARAIEQSLREKNT